MRQRGLIACCSWWVWALAALLLVIGATAAATRTQVARVSNTRSWAVFCGQWRIGVELFDATCQPYYGPNSIWTFGHVPRIVLQPDEHPSIVLPFFEERNFWRSVGNDQLPSKRTRVGLPVWVPLLVVGLALAIGVQLAARRHRASLAGVCACGYPRFGLDSGAACPECGATR